MSWFGSRTVRCPNCLMTALCGSSADRDSSSGTTQVTLGSIIILVDPDAVLHSVILVEGSPVQKPA